MATRQERSSVYLTLGTRQGIWESDVDFMMLECLLFQGETVFGTNQGGEKLHSAGRNAIAELVRRSGALLANRIHANRRPACGLPTVMEGTRRSEQWTTVTPLTTWPTKSN